MKSETLFMNISTDQIIISDGEINIFLNRNDVEKVLWPKLVQLVNKWNYNNIIVLNWPWWFTNLRVWTLCINILNALMESQINVYDISKIDLYKKAYERWLLPKLGIIYIGQRRNVWLWDFEKWEKIWQYSFDELKENLHWQFFLDEVIDENYYPEWMNEYNKIKATFDGDNLNIDYLNEMTKFHINDLGINPLKTITPNYMMDPSITITNR